VPCTGLKSLFAGGTTRPPGFSPCGEPASGLCFGFAMRRHLQRHARFLCGVAALIGSAIPVAAEPALLTIGPGWAWVREFFPSSGPHDLDRIVWSNPPPQLDLSTLQVWNVRRPWPVREWHWQPARPASPADESNPLRWSLNPAAAPVANTRPLELRLAEPLSHRMGHSLTYRLPGFDWHAFYRVTCAASARNRSMPCRSISPLICASRTTPPRRIPKRGFRWSAWTASCGRPASLSDCWISIPTPRSLSFGSRGRSPPRCCPAHYPLQTEAAITAHGQSEILFARVTRKPAQITHICDSDAIPAPPCAAASPSNECCSSPTPPPWASASPAAGRGRLVPRRSPRRPVPVGPCPAYPVPGHPATEHGPGSHRSRQPPGRRRRSPSPRAPGSPTISSRWSTSWLRLSASKSSSGLPPPRNGTWSAPRCPAASPLALCIST
jgi:hypothetical protein